MSKELDFDCYTMDAWPVWMRSRTGLIARSNGGWLGIERRWTESWIPFSMLVMRICNHTWILNQRSESKLNLSWIYRKVESTESWIFRSAWWDSRAWWGSPARSDKARGLWGQWMMELPLSENRRMHSVSHGSKRLQLCFRCLLLFAFVSWPCVEGLFISVPYGAGRHLQLAVRYLQKHVRATLTFFEIHFFETRSQPS